jgi:hypothetical protein
LACRLERASISCYGNFDFSPLNSDVRVKAQFVGGEIEVSVNGRLALAAVSFTRAKGRLGLFANCGSVALENAEVTAMRAPCV